MTTKEALAVLATIAVVLVLACTAGALLATELGVMG